MIRKFTPRSPVLFPVNVKIIQKSTSGEIIDTRTAKNMILKNFGLYSWIHLLMGSFHNGTKINEQMYIPKYLAVGSNQAPSNGAPGVDTAVKVTDISLFHELSDNVDQEIPSRIKLNRLNFIEDTEEEPYLKIQYEAYIPEDRYVDMTIGELALMTDLSGFNAFARISGFEPFKKVAHSVVQIIWEVTIISVESNTRFIPPIKTYLQEAIEKAINVLQVDTTDPTVEGNVLTGAREALDKLIEPGSTDSTGLWYLLNDNEQITQEAINNFLSKPFVSLDNTGLIPLINLFPSGKDFRPTIT